MLSSGFLLLGCTVRSVLRVSRRFRARCRGLNGRRALRHLLPLLLLFFRCSTLTGSQRELFGVRRPPAPLFSFSLVKNYVESLREFESISITRRQYGAPTVVTQVPGEVVALTRYRGLQFCSFYLGQGESPPRGKRGDERQRVRVSQQGSPRLFRLGLLED